LCPFWGPICDFALSCKQCLRTGHCLFSLAGGADSECTARANLPTSTEQKGSRPFWKLQTALGLRMARRVRVWMLRGGTTWQTLTR
jgi:hypothetical protein